MQFEIGTSRALEVTFIDVEWPALPTPTTTLYRYTADPDGAGTFDYISNLDIHADDEPELDRRELLQVRSRWLATGPGRADVFASKGDLEDGDGVALVQCWGADFKQTHTAYETAAGVWKEGDADTCPFSDAQQPEFADFDPTDFDDEDLIRALPTVGDFSLGLNPIADPVPEDQRAGYYRMTVGLLVGIQVQVSSVLRILRSITRQSPTTCDARGCVWGPWTDWDAGISWRLDVSREADQSFSYRLGAKYFGESSDAIRVVCEGGYIESDGDDGQGWFSFDNAVLNELDPNEKATQSVRAEYARLGVGVALSMRVDDEDGTEQGRYHVSVVDGAGTLDARFETDLDSNRPGRRALETIEARVRWLGNSAGTGNLIVYGGNLSVPAAAVECWDEHAELTYNAAVSRGETDREPLVDQDKCVHSDFQTAQFRPLGDEE